MLLVLGFAAHAVWRLAEAIGDREHEGHGPAGLAKRAGYAGLALWYAALAGLTGSVLLGQAANSDEKREQATKGVLSWSLGRELVAAVGLGFLAAAVSSGALATPRGRARHHRRLPRRRGVVV